jgi:hypothetical protein
VAARRPVDTISSDLFCEYIAATTFAEATVVKENAKDAEI